MSHNNKKISSISPSTLSVYSVSLENMSDVDASSISNGDTLSWNSSSSKWEGSSVSGTLESEYIKIGEGAQSAYSNSNATTSNGDPIAFYGPNVVNNISGASLSGSGTDWYERITLPAGKYEIDAAVKFVFSANGYLTFSIRKNNSSSEVNNGSRARIGGGLDYANAFGTSKSKYIFNANENDYIEVVINSQSNLSTVSNQGNTPSVYNQITIRKI